jgi:hypothetical protein
MAERMQTSRSQLDRLLAPDSDKVQFDRPHRGRRPRNESPRKVIFWIFDEQGRGCPAWELDRTPLVIAVPIHFEHATARPLMDFGPVL